MIFLSLDPVASAVLANPQSWNKYTYALNNPLKWVDPNGETVRSALGQISEFAAAIEFASGVTGGRVTPLEIARIVFQENKSDYILMGPELKNVGARLRFSLAGAHGSFGIVEMRTDTAARLLGWDPDNLSAEQQDRIQKMLSNPIDSLILAALYLDQLKEQNPGASTDEILNAYNTGSTTINDDNSQVYARSGAYLHEIEESLDKGPNEGGKLRVVRCGGGYRFENQCPE